MGIVNDTTLVPVRNMVNHRVVYTIPEEHRRVVFEAFQEKKIPAKELRALNYTVGGSILLKNYLCVKSIDMRAEFNIPSDQIEYDWTEKDIQHVLLSNDSPIEQLEDALDFAPQGIREMIVDYAVEWKIPDSNRRKVISKMMNLDIDEMIKFAEMVEESNDTVPQNTHRRLSDKPATSRTGRRLQN